MIRHLLTALFWILIVSTLLINFARWFHPATFSEQTPVVLLIVAFAAYLGSLFFQKYDSKN